MDSQVFVRPGPSGRMQEQQDSPMAPPPNRRRGRLKVKTGCRNCKAAHVKCDEQQPKCGRCHRRRTGCEYPHMYRFFENSGSKSGDRKQHTTSLNHRDRPCDRDVSSASHKGQRSKKDQTLRPLLPAGKTNLGRSTTSFPPDASAQLASKIRLLPQLSSSSQLLTSLRPQDKAYYETFRHRVVLSLGYGESEFWRRTVLREASRDECIHSAVLALGALARAQELLDEDEAVSLSGKSGSTVTTKVRSRVPLYKSGLSPSSSKLRNISSAQSSTLPSIPPSSSSSSPGRAGSVGSSGSARPRRNDHYYHALVHYTRAIGKFRRLISRLAQEPRTARTILVATVLLVSFESLQGNSAAADQLSAHTLSLLKETIAKGALRSARGERTTNAEQHQSKNISDTNHDDSVAEDNTTADGHRQLPPIAQGTTMAFPTPSLIAAALDDEGVAEAEATLVRNTVYTAALSPFYPKGRQILFSLPVPMRRWPTPPASAGFKTKDVARSAEMAEFVMMWDQCMALTAMWFLRTQMEILATRITGPGDEEKERSAWDQRYRERGKVWKVCEDWLDAVRERQRLTAPWLGHATTSSALPPKREQAGKGGVGTSSPEPSTDEARRATTEQEEDTQRQNAHAFYNELAIRINVVFYTICTAFDVAGNARDTDVGTAKDYRHTMASLFAQAEAVVAATERQRQLQQQQAQQLQPPQASEQTYDSDCTRKHTKPKDASPPPPPPPSPFRDTATAHASVIPILSSITQFSRSPTTRPRALALWGRLITPQSHWDAQAMYLAMQAIVALEESARVPKNGAGGTKTVGPEDGTGREAEGEIPLEKQWVWIGGDWNEDYTVFRARLVPRLVGLGLSLGVGGGEKGWDEKVVEMPAA